MSKTGRRKTRVNITIEERLYKRAVDEGLFRRREFSSLMNQLLQSYLDLGSVNALDNQAYDVLERFISKALSEFRETTSNQLDRIEKLEMEKYILLLMMQGEHAPDKTSQDEIDKLLRRIQMQLELNSDFDVKKDLNNLAEKLQNNNNRSVRPFTPDIEKEKEDNYEETKTKEVQKKEDDDFYGFKEEF